jgi:hypothetical protein
MVKDDDATTFDSVLRVFTELGKLLNDIPNDSGSGSISPHVENILVEMLAGIVTLMGHTYKALNSGLACMPIDSIIHMSHAFKLGVHRARKSLEKRRS